MRNGPIHSFHLIRIVIRGEATRYYRDSLFHREDGPAVDWPGMYQIWSINGYYHRTDGPAVIFHKGELQFWLEGRQYRPTSDGLPDPQNPIEEWYPDETEEDIQ